jgi:hypothetical protein
MWDAMRRWFSPAREAKTNLTAAQALQIARDAAASDPMGELLSITMLKERDGKPAWLVASATVGASLEVWIDDETGRVLELKHVGLR